MTLIQLHIPPAVIKGISVTDSGGVIIEYAGFHIVDDIAIDDRSITADGSLKVVATSLTVHAHPYQGTPGDEQ